MAEQRLVINAQAFDQNTQSQVIVFRGYLDKSTLKDAEASLLKFVETFQGSYLVFDFGPLTYINSEGLGFLTVLHTTLSQAGKKFVIVNLSAQVKEIFDVIGLGHVIPIYGSVNEFYASLS